MPWIEDRRSVGGDPAGSRPRRYGQVVETLAQAGEHAAELVGTETTNQKPQMHLRGVEEVVADKGYHSGRVLAEMKSAKYEPTFQKRNSQATHWEGKREQQQAVYANRNDSARVWETATAEKSELIERSFATATTPGE